MFYDDDINVITHFPVASISQCFLNADLKNDKVFWVRILEMCFNCHYKKILIVLKIGFIFFIKRYFPICIESSAFFVSSLCLAHFSHCQLYDFCIVLIFKNLLVSLFIFNIYLDLSCIIMAFILFCIWLVSHSCAVYTCHMKCVFVFVCVCTQCVNVPTETLLQKLNHDTMFTHNAVRHNCTVWCQCICPQCSSGVCFSSNKSDLRSADSFTWHCSLFWHGFHRVYCI